MADSLTLHNIQMKNSDELKTHWRWHYRIYGTHIEQLLSTYRFDDWKCAAKICQMTS